MNKLKEIPNEVLRISNDIRDFKPSDDKILEVSSKIFISESIREKESMLPSYKEMLGEEDKEPLATERQVFALRKLGIESPENITKREAIQIIKESKNK